MISNVFLCVFLAVFGAHHFAAGQLCARLGRHLLETKCILTPEGGEGPYYLSYPELIRSDIREDRQGLKLKLKFTLTDVTKCEPIRNASIDVWQADPYGFYSSYTKNSPDAKRRRRRAAVDEAKLALGVPHSPPTDNTTFLRGVQFTDDQGRAEFTTVFPGKKFLETQFRILLIKTPPPHFPAISTHPLHPSSPGWYAFRTPHIHVMAHVDGKTVHVSQLYFQNSLINQIKRFSPYKGRAKLAAKNEADYIFRRDSGHLTMINNVRPSDGKRLSRGLTGEVTLGMDPSKQSVKALKP